MRNTNYFSNLVIKNKIKIKYEILIITEVKCCQKENLQYFSKLDSSTLLNSYHLHHRYLSLSLNRLHRELLPPVHYIYQARRDTGLSIFGSFPEVLNSFLAESVPLFEQLLVFLRVQPLMLPPWHRAHGKPHLQFQRFQRVYPLIHQVT